MTKHAPDENALRYPLSVEEPKKLVENKTFVTCDAQVSPELESKFEVATISTTVEPEMNVLEKIIPKIYDLEELFEPQKSVKINLDLDLYQME